MKPRVIVTRRWPAAVEQLLAENFDTTFNRGDVPLTATQLKAAFLNFDAILPTVSDKLPKSVFPESELRTKLIANYGVGFSHIDIDAARERERLAGNSRAARDDR